MKLISLLLITLLSACHLKVANPNINKYPDAKEALLLGTFHFNNPGGDAVKNDVLDVMDTDGQQQLEQLANKIVKYKPSKIFVEWDIQDQESLDKLYQKYVEGTYFDDKKLSDFYRKNEIFQLGFRVAKKLKHKKVYAVDYSNIDLDFPAVMQAISDSKQTDLKKEFDETIKKMGEETSKKMATMTLEEIYLDGNRPEEVSANIELYTELTIKAGALENTAGAEMVSQWYKRNLLIWSNIQKIVDENDTRIFVLFGGGHTAILDQLIARNRNWKVADMRRVFNGRYIDVDF
jgi:hypothetical protein